MITESTKTALSKLATMHSAVTGKPVEKSMTGEQFIEYAVEQIEKSHKDSTLVAKSRLSALRKSVVAMRKESNYDDDTLDSVKVPVFVEDTTARDDKTDKTTPVASIVSANAQDGDVFTTKAEAEKAGKPFPGAAKPFGAGGKPAKEDDAKKADDEDDEDEDSETDKRAKAAKSGETATMAKASEEWPDDMTVGVVKMAGGLADDDWGRDAK